MKQSKRLKSIFGMGFASMVQVMVNIVRVKIIAVLLGTIGVGITSLINNFMSTVIPLTSLGLNQGIIKALNDDINDEERIKKIQATSYITTMLISIILSIIVLIIPDLVVKRDNVNLSNYIYILAILSIPFLTLNQINISIINGFKLIKELGLANVISSIISLIISVYLTYKFKLNGAVLSIFVSSVLITLVYWKLGRTNDIKLKYSFSMFDYDISVLKYLVKFGVMSIFVGFITNYSVLLVRKIIVKNLGIDAVGVFQADWALINQYLGLVLSSIGVYLIPTLCSLRLNEEIVDELNATLNIMIKIIVPIMSLLILLSHPIIVLLYSNKFSSASVLLPLFIIGDFFKLIAWVIGSTFWTIPKLGKLAFINGVNSIILVIMTLLLTNKLGLYGIALAYIIQNAVELAYNYFILKKDISLRFYKINKKNITISFTVLIINIVCNELIHSFAINLVITSTLLVIWILIMIKKDDLRHLKNLLRRQ